MSSETRNELDWDAVFLILPLFLIVLIVGFVWGDTRSGEATGYFYVQASSSGYSVSIDTLNGTDTQVSRYMSLKDAEKVCDQLNKDLETHQREPNLGVY